MSTNARRMISAACSALALLTAWGGPAFAQTSPPSSGPQASLRAMLPANIRNQGFVTAAVDPSFGPMNIFNTKDDPDTLLGLVPDMMNGIGELLGITIKHDKTAFAGIVPGLQTGRWNLADNAMSDTLERQKVVDMLDIFISSSIILVNKGNPLKISKVGDLCGKNVGMNPGTAQLAYLEDFSAKNCSTPVNFTVLKARADVFVAMQSGRADAHLIDAVSAAGVLNPKFNPEIAAKFDSVSTPGVKIAPNYGAWAFPKDQSQLRDAFAAALQAMIDNGAYLKILEKWGIPDYAIPKVLINGASTHPLQ